MTTRLLTLGLPVYNAMPYLRESMEAILRQSYSDFEILVINDGSTDASREYLESIRDPRVRVVHQDNRGLTATLNRMLTEIRTPWLVRQDADDVPYRNRLGITAEYILRFPESGLFYSLAEYYPRGTVGQFRTTTGDPAKIRELVFSGYLPAICHPTVTLNVEKTLRAGGYRFNLHVEDIDLWWRMALDYDLRYIPEVTLGCRQNVASISSANLERQAVNVLYIQYLLLSHLWKRAPLPYEQARLSLTRLFQSRKFEFKAHIRAFNIALGRGERLRALSELGRAWLASPGDFSRRCFDEVLSNRLIFQGESPALFRQYEHLLWPVEGSSQSAIANDSSSFDLSLTQSAPKS